MKAIRGAIFVEKDSCESIKNATFSLMNALFTSNSLKDEEVVSIIFSLTRNLRSMNPATVFRKTGHDVPLMCFQEAEFDGDDHKIIRVLVLTERERNSRVVNIYKNGAEHLKSWWDDAYTCDKRSKS